MAAPTDFSNRPFPATGSTLSTRSIVFAVIVSLITFGIYGLYWFVKMTNEIHTLAGQKTSASGIWALVFSFITFGIYGFYWVYKMGETLNMAKRNRGLHAASSDTIIYLLFSLFGLGIISVILMQSTMNTLIEMDQGV